MYIWMASLKLILYTIGIWPDYTNSKDIISVDRHINNKIIVTGDIYGKIKLFNYPALQVLIL